MKLVRILLACFALILFVSLMSACGGGSERNDLLAASEELQVEVVNLMRDFRILLDEYSSLQEEIRYLQEQLAAIDPPTKVCVANFCHPLKKGDCDTMLCERFNWCRNKCSFMK